MTEKRFEIKIGEFEEENIVDNLNKRTIREISDMCKKMNELHEENQRLKERLHQRGVVKQRRIDYDEFWSQKNEHLAWKRVDVK